MRKGWTDWQGLQPKKYGTCNWTILWNKIYNFIVDKKLFIYIYHELILLSLILFQNAWKAFSCQMGSSKQVSMQSICVCMLVPPRKNVGRLPSGSQTTPAGSILMTLCALFQSKLMTASTIGLCSAVSFLFVT